jgi:hypothetical protein
MRGESGGKRWLKEISLAARPAAREAPKRKNAASPKGSGVLFDHDT